jgi:signal transduction histidine kinase
VSDRDPVLRWLHYAAHDVANPITALRLLAELASADAEGSVKTDLEDILEEADLATVLLDSMGRVSESLQTTEDPMQTWFDMELVGVLRQAIARPAFQRRMHLEEQVDGSVMVFGDAKLLLTAFHDVFANARRLCSGRAIRVVVSEDDGFWVCVQHPGPGIASQLQDESKNFSGVLKLRDAHVPISAGGLVHAASVFARHGAEMSWVDVDGDVGMELRICFPDTTVVWGASP